jgi:hypothetical protein
MDIDSNSGVRWIVGILAIVAIVALFVLARGEPDRTPRAAAPPTASELRV